jgi:DNA-directed RNA polymerase specialized sigma24 family protein
MVTDGEAQGFLGFAREVEPRLRAALVARYGHTIGREAAVDALAWAWEHWDRLERAANPAGYLYRVGCRRASRWRWSRPSPEVPRADGHPPVEPGLAPALEKLSTGQRQALVLVEGYGMTYTEASELLGVSRSTVQTHVERALARLRHELGVRIDG